jgi:hypothetical protein
MYTAMCKVTFFEDCNIITDYSIITNVDSHSEAVIKLEDYYGTSIESVKVTLIDTPIALINETTYQALIEDKLV